MSPCRGHLAQLSIVMKKHQTKPKQVKWVYLRRKIKLCELKQIDLKSLSINGGEASFVLNTHLRIISNCLKLNLGQITFKRFSAWI